jgi:hypothetical protein
MRTVLNRDWQVLRLLSSGYADALDLEWITNSCNAFLKSSSVIEQISSADKIWILASWVQDWAWLWPWSLNGWGAKFWCSSPEELKSGRHWQKRRARKSRIQQATPRWKSQSAGHWAVPPAHALRCHRRVHRDFVADAHRPLSHVELRPWHKDASGCLLCGNDTFAIPYYRELTDGLTLDHVGRWSRESKVILEHRDRLFHSERIRLSLNSTVTSLN